MVGYLIVAMLAVSFYVGWAAQWGRGHTGAVWGLVTFILCAAGVWLGDLAMLAMLLTDPSAVDDLYSWIAYGGPVFAVWVIMSLVVGTLPKRGAGS